MFKKFLMIVYSSNFKNISIKLNHVINSSKIISINHSCN